MTDEEEHTRKNQLVHKEEGQGRIRKYSQDRCIIQKKLEQLIHSL